MILAKLKDAPQYRGIHPRLDRVLELLNEEFLSTVGTEVMQLEGEALYVSRCDYDTVPFEESFFEAHRKYLDVHVMVSGGERVDIAHPDGLEETEHRGDFYAYRGEGGQSLVLRPDSFLVVFPGDAHRLKIQLGESQSVSKVVFKALINE